METPRLLTFKVLSLLILALLSFFWFWFELYSAFNTSITDPEITKIIFLFVPIIPLVLGLTFLAIMAVLQNTPAWAKWLIVTLISLPIFFISTPPNLLALAATILMFFGSLWFFERNKNETQDHLNIRMWHLSFSGGISTYLYMIILIISLLAALHAGPQIKQNGIVLPVSWFEPGSPLIKIANQFYQIDIEGITNSNNTKQLTSKEINYLAKQLKINYERNDKPLDLIRKKIESQINLLFKGSTNLILFLYGLTIFTILLLVTFPLTFLYSMMLCILFFILKNFNFIKINERTVDAEQPFYN